ncbi:MAG: hypothetical protein SOX45_06600, partial [Lachnospiraceae bacterium]|nr:hypothetical protein [Lachnospiraceae bacterium]
ASFLREDVFLRERVIRTCLKEAGCSLKDMRREHVERVVKLAEMQSGAGWNSQEAGRQEDLLST